MSAAIRERIQLLTARLEELQNEKNKYKKYYEMDLEELSEFVSELKMIHSTRRFFCEVNCFSLSEIADSIENLKEELVIAENRELELKEFYEMSEDQVDQLISDLAKILKERLKHNRNFLQNHGCRKEGVNEYGSECYIYCETCTHIIDNRLFD